MTATKRAMVDDQNTAKRCPLLTGTAAACLALLLIAAADAMPQILHLCDPGEWLVAQHGRESLQAAASAEEGFALVVTGGALRSSGAPAGSEATFAVAMLDAAGADVANLAHRDLAGDAESLAEALTAGRTQFISASFSRPDQPWRPFVSVRLGGRTVVFIGVAGRSPAMELPDSGAVPGLAFAPPPEAVAAALEQAPDADALVLLADLPLPEAVRLRQEFPQFQAVLCSGRGGVQLAEAAHGGVFLSPPGGERAALWAEGEPSGRMVVLAPPEQINPQYAEASERFGFAPAPVASVPAEALAPAKPLAGLSAGQTEALNVTVENRAVRWTIHSAAWLDSLGPARAHEGRRWLVFDAEWKNLLTPQMVREQEVPVAYRIPTLGDHLYLVEDGRKVVPMAQAPGAHNLLEGASEIFLEYQGATQRGLLAFDLPADAAPEGLEFRYYDFAHGHMVATVLDAHDPPAEAAPDAPLLPTAVNEIVELGVFDMRMEQTLDGRQAPEGMAYLSLDIRARSMFTFEVPASAFVPGAAPDERTEVGTVADWLEARKYMHVVADGEYAYQPEADLTEFAESPRFLPDLMTGGETVFLVPARFESLALRGDFPNARMPDGALIRPEPIRMDLSGEPAEPPYREWIWQVDDETIEVSVTGQHVAESFAGADAPEGRIFLVLDVTVRNSGEKPEFFQTLRQLQHVGARGRQSPPHPATFEGVFRPVENVWLPDGERRSFQVAYLVNRDEEQPRLAYRGFSRADVVNLLPVDQAPQLAALDPPDPDEAPLPDLEPPEPEPEEVPPPVAVDEEDAPPLTGPATMVVIEEEEMEAWARKRNRESVNLALRPLGARILADTDMREDRVPRLHDGRIGMRGTHRWQKGTYRIRLAGQRPAMVNQIALAVDNWSDRLTLTVEAADGQGGYALLAAVRGIRKREPHVRVFDFEPVETDEIRITAQGERLVMRVYDAMVFEGPLERKADSVVSRGGMNISRIEYGGSVFHGLEDGHLAHLLTEPEEADFRARWRRRDERRWIGPITLAFQANRAALVEAVELWPSADEGRRGFVPERIRLSASPQEPFEGYETLGEFDVSSAQTPWRLEFEEPVRARFLRVEFRRRTGADELCIGEFVVREGTEPGYESVLVRGDGVEWRHRDQPTLASLMGDESKQVRKVAANAFRQSPANLALEEWAGSTLDHPGQRHLYRVKLDYDAAIDVPELQLHMAPFLKGRVRVLDAEGQEVAAPEPEQRGAGASLRYPLALEPGEYKVEVVSSPIYLFMGFDTSGSMGRALPITRESLPALLSDLPEGLYIALGSSLYNRETRKRFTLFSPYVRDGEALREANEALFSQGGGSDWYNFLRDMMEWADENAPPDAATAKVLVADGVGMGDYPTMWDRLHISRQRLYTVGWGSQTLRLDHWDHNTGWTASRGLFNSAWYRGGRYFEPQADHELVETYQAILRDVQEPAEYALRVHVRQRQPGRIETAAPAGEVRPILFVLDASGSMMIELEGRTRLDVAFDVMEQVVNTLPEGAPVGLRVYGHRYRAIGAEREKAAVDTELLVPIGPLDKAAFIRTLRGIDARGATPLAHTIAQIPGDLRGVERPLVIVLTDGVESFRRDPVAKSRALRERHPDMEYVVVGFMIDQMVDRENLLGMAQAGGGVYYNAMDSASLVRSLEQAISPVIPYAIQDWKGRKAAEGRFGDSHELPEGAYKLHATIGEGQASLPLRIRAGRTVRLAVEDLPEPQPIKAIEEEPDAAPEAEEPAAPARFCVHCGKRPPEGARFCTRCGRPMQ